MKWTDNSFKQVLKMASPAEEAHDILTKMVEKLKHGAPLIVAIVVDNDAEFYEFDSPSDPELHELIIELRDTEPDSASLFFEAAFKFVGEGAPKSSRGWTLLTFDGLTSVHTMFFEDGRSERFMNRPAAGPLDNLVRSIIQRPML